MNLKEEKKQLFHVLPEWAFCKVMCNSRANNNKLMFLLDEFLYCTLHGIQYSERRVNTCQLGTFTSEFDKNSNAHFYLVGVISKLIRMEFFSAIGVEVSKSKSGFSKIRLVSQSGTLIFYFDKDFGANTQKYIPDTYKRRNREELQYS